MKITGNEVAQGGGIQCIDNPGTSSIDITFSRETWSCGLLIANINGLGNIIITVLYGGGTVKCYDLSGSEVTASYSPTPIVGTPKVTMHSPNNANWASATFIHC